MQMHATGTDIAIVEARTAAVRLSGWYLKQAAEHETEIRRLVRVESKRLTTACNHAGMPAELAATIGGLLASVLDDLHAASNMRRTDLGRTIRLERVLEACREPYAHALRIAIACSPVNGRAAVAHWDVVCPDRKGELAWLLGMYTPNAEKFAKRVDKRP
jgi:hypothetical protein